MAISKRVRYQVLQRDKYTCRYCGRTPPDVVLEIDHVQPRLHGGQDDATNLVVACEGCNAGKSATIPEKWLIRETSRRQRAWEKGKAPDDPDGEYAEMYAFIDASYHLEESSASQVISCLMRAGAEAYPYRPTASELIVAAAALDREGYLRDPARDEWVEAPA